MDHISLLNWLGVNIGYIMDIKRLPLAFGPTILPNSHEFIYRLHSVARKDGASFKLRTHHLFTATFARARLLHVFT